MESNSSMQQQQSGMGYTSQMGLHRHPLVLGMCRTYASWRFAPVALLLRLWALPRRGDPSENEPQSLPKSAHSFCIMHMKRGPRRSSRDIILLYSRRPTNSWSQNQQQSTLSIIRVVQVVQSSIINNSSTIWIQESL